MEVDRNTSSFLYLPLVILSLNELVLNVTNGESSFKIQRSPTEVDFSSQNAYHSPLLDGYTTAHDGRCGGVLQALHEPNILSYKFGKPMQRFESCIWTIHAPNRTFIKLFNVETYFRFENNNINYLSVGYFNDHKYDTLSALSWIKLPFSLILPLEVPGPVVFIHFVSTHVYPSLGFRLSYGEAGEERPIPYNFDNYFVGGEYGIFKYPPNGGKYGNNQRTTIVVKANSSLSLEGHSSASVLYLINKNVEESPNCHVDNINLYKFEDKGNLWYKNKTMCGRTPRRYGFTFYYPRNDPIIITFKSDQSGVGDGFEFFWMNAAF